MSLGEKELGRRRLLQAAFAGTATAMLPLAATPALADVATDGKKPADRAARYSRRARRLVQDSLVIDMLSPLRIDMRDDAYALPLNEDRLRDFRESGINVMHNAWGIGGPDAHREVLAHMAGWHAQLARHPELFLLVDKAADMERARQSGRVAVITGVQNAEHFRSAKDVELFHGIGQRCAQLTYNSQNLIGAGSTERIDGGVSDFGAAIIAEMDRVGMLVDLSHCGERTTLDGIELAKGPVAITHSNCKALVDHPRLKSDEVIRKLAAKGGVMGITGVRMFVRDHEPTTIDHIVDHIDHVAKLVGIEHVGIGSDTDLYGYDAMPTDQYEALKAGYKASYGFRDRIDIDGFDHPLQVFDLTEALIRRGYSDANIRAVLGGNFQRLLTAVWG